MVKLGKLADGKTMVKLARNARWKEFLADLRNYCLVSAYLPAKNDDSIQDRASCS